MYKRRARVLFLEEPGLGLAQIAAAWASHLAAEWMEARAGAWGPRGSSGAETAIAASGLVLPAWVVPEASLSWADLLVPLTPGAATRCARPPAGVQVKVWSIAVPDAADAAGWHDLAAQLRSRVEGMAGGMRMLAGAAPTSDAARARRPRAAE